MQPRRSPANWVARSSNKGHWSVGNTWCDSSFRIAASVASTVAAGWPPSSPGQSDRAAHSENLLLPIRADDHAQHRMALDQLLPCPFQPRHIMPCSSNSK